MLSDSEAHPGEAPRHPKLHKLLTRNTASLAIGTFSALVAQLWMQSRFSKVDYADSVWITSVASTLATILFLGKDLAIARVIASNGPIAFAWKSVIVRHLMWAMPLGALLGAIVSVLADTGIVWAAVTSIIVVRQLCLGWSAQIHFGMFRHATGTLLKRLHWIGLVLAAAIFVGSPQRLPSLQLLLLIVSLTSILASWWLVTRLQQGCAKSPLILPRLGYSLFLVALSDTAAQNLDRVALRLVCDAPTYADYSVLLTVSIGFDLLLAASMQVLMSIYARAKYRNPPWTATFVTALISLCGFYLFATLSMDILALVHADKYSTAAMFVIPVGALGAVKLAISPTIAWYYATARTTELAVFGLLNLLVTLAMIALGLLLASSLSPAVVPLAVALSVAMRLPFVLLLSAYSKRPSR